MREGERPRGRGRPKGPGVDAQQRREELLDAAERAIQAKGTSVSMADIAKEAGYARSALYAAFSNRAAVFTALSERHAGLIMLGMADRAAAPDEPRIRFQEMLDVLFAWAEDRPQLYWALVRPLDDDDAGPGLFDLITGAVEAMLELILAAAADSASADSAAADTEAAAPWAQSMMGSAFAVVDWWLKAGTAMPRTRLVGYLSDLYWRGRDALPEGWLGPPSEPEAP